jgi:uncharacterized OB-fold protein
MTQCGKCGELFALLKEEACDKCKKHLGRSEAKQQSVIVRGVVVLLKACILYVAQLNKQCMSCGAVLVFMPKAICGMCIQHWRGVGGELSDVSLAKFAT